MFLPRIALALAVIAASVAATATAQDQANPYFAQDQPNDYYQATNYVKTASDQSSGDVAYASCCDASCCDDCSCDSCCEPLWSVRANALYMMRKSPVSRTLLSDSTPAEVFNANQFGFEAKAGLDVAAAYRLNCCQSVEVRYMVLDDFTAYGDFTNSSSTVYFETNPQTSFNNALAPLNGQLQYQSEIESLEANLRHEACAYTLLAGFRYASVDERFGMLLSDSNGDSEYQWNSDNDLYGLQLGIEGSLWENCCGSLAIDGFFKAGVYYNDVNTSFNAVGPVHGFNDFGAANTDGVAGLFEAGLGARYQVTCNLAVRAGYQVMWLEGIALATDQLSGTANFNGIDGQRDMSVVKNGNLLLHGGYLGVEYLW